MNNALTRQLRLYQLIDQYDFDTIILSYHDRDHVAYKEIVAMGKDIIPLLLNNLGNGWVPIMTLFDIVGKVFEVDLETEAGRYDILNEKWYVWGQDNGYI